MEKIASQQNIADVSQRLIGLLMRPDQAPPWQRLDAASRFVLQSAYFLIDGVEGSDPQVAVVLERMLSQMARTTQQRQVQHKGRVRGKIVWPATYKARYSDNFDLTSYVCREAQSRFDTPENQLLKFMLERTYESFVSIPPVLYSGTCIFPARSVLPSITVADRLRPIESILNRFRRDARMRNVSLPDSIKELHLMHAETSRTEEYAEIAVMYRRHQRLFAQRDWWKEIASIGRRILPLPGRVTPEGELWMDVGAAVIRGGT